MCEWENVYPSKLKQNSKIQKMYKIYRGLKTMKYKIYKGLNKKNTKYNTNEKNSEQK